ncbi:MAG TPA: diaminopimelate decarboxylase [Bryobacteraceae bacterium]|nr:diaminopimelate decarboxylase [Bryobacteraceae bacterium]
MKPAEYRDRTLTVGGVDLADIAARAGTPCYVYSAATILDNYGAYEHALQGSPHTVCYAVKANGSLAILKLLAQAGAGFDIVSGGELYRVRKAGGDPAKVVFSGVGKTAEEIDAALLAGIFAFNCESEPELALLDSLAHRRGIQARVALRVNPDVDASTHAYISTGSLAHKFGIDIAEAEGVYERARQLSNLLLEGVSCHIGSQQFDQAPMMEAVDRVLDLIVRLRAKGFAIRHVDLGGGLGIAYKRDEDSPDIGQFVSALREKIAGRDLHLFLEPGRSIVGNSGVLLTRVLYRKKAGEKEFVIVDAAMNDLIRPALYDAHHEILPLRARPGDCSLRADVVGPVCESGDFLAQDRQMPEVFPGDLLAVCTAGAYGFVQASTYNARPRPAEVLIENGSWRVIRKRETFHDLVRGEE